tara:strand:+ start:314 stop:481 length:168 start_codon:yes stop_codon:yes gene_type:complete
MKAKAISQYKAQIKGALANPALTKEQRIELRAKLQTAGKIRNYATEKPLNGAIEN